MSYTIQLLKLLLISFLFVSISGCSNQFSNKKTTVLSVTLNQESSTGEATVTLYPTHYTMEVHNELYKYELDNQEWLQLEKILQTIDLKNLPNYTNTTNNTGSRLVVRDLKSKIQVNTSKGNFESPIYHNAQIANELTELHQFLVRFFPLN